jgi:hypothetical protein
VEKRDTAWKAINEEYGQCHFARWLNNATDFEYVLNIYFRGKTSCAKALQRNILRLELAFFQNIFNGCRFLKVERQKLL